MRRHLVPLLRQGSHGLPDDLEGFDFFDTLQDHPVDPDQQILDQVGQHLRGHAETLSASTFLAPAGQHLLASPRLTYWNRQAWSVQVKATDKATAQRQGLSLQRNLLAKKGLHSSVPYLHELPLFVRFQDGWVKLEGLAPKEKAAPSGPSLNDQKHQISQQGELVFGAGSIRITGGDGAYRLTITPKLKIHQGVFRETSVAAPTLAELGQKLAQAIQKIQALLAKH